ncbi:MAG: Asp-tRNA(Asn)/Glu-tRNA(Gln) amidotransferase subunit GatC [Planctomycetota bacterium]|nr:Asp-tRNA(Asn)/Glu-tRNA(Gln) amidotransferase subunit GatC [Planctomycetota bacterium]
MRKVAQLARLELTDESIELYAEQLSSILEHIANLETLDVEGVEPMAHPLPVTNRLGEDVPTAGLPVEVVLENAPAREADFIAVPKVLGGES